MNKIFSFKEFLHEKLSVSQYREIYKRIVNKQNKKYEDWFEGKQRIYIPITKEVKSSEPEIIPSNDIVTIIKNAGYKIEDYKEGIASKGKNIIKIGKILTGEVKRHPEDDKIKKALDDFNLRLTGKGNKKEDEDLIVISRHPYDIAGMSTDRGWKSCKDLVDGINSHYIPAEIDAGIMIAYQIKNTDDNIEKPRGRILIIPYYQEKNPDDIYMFAVDKVYGTVASNFVQLVQKWLDSKQGKKKGLYCLDHNVYDDMFKHRKIVGKNTRMEWLQSNNISEYTVDSDGSIDIIQSVDLINVDEEIPVKIRKVKGDFMLHQYNIFTFSNFPDIITGDFDVLFAPNIKTADMPKEIMGNITFDGCEELRSLNNLQPIIYKNLNISYCPNFDLLENLPDAINGNLILKNFKTNIKESEIRAVCKISKDVILPI